jgi:diaminohydroxyphosphoribosylaminopyrimidine deaminase/5-amino-6-(5-phosphoribosylamino)uracil reductase
MARALELAARGVGRTFPNPPVGAVLVRGGRIVGEGFHRRAGGPHAEIEALRAAGRRAEGAELFVTLEPCAHHGRTPPCVEALLPLGLARVVVAVRDPNPRVRGRSIARLRRAGVPVVVGEGGAAAAELLVGHISLVTRRRPHVVLKLATTLDGRIAAAGGDARWITSAAARRVAHGLRDVCDGVLVGAGTVRADDPELTCRLRGGRDPVRVVLSGARLDLPRRARLLAGGGAPTWVVAPRGAAAGRVAALERTGVRVLLLRGRGGRVPFADVVRALGSEIGLTTLLVEGGAEVAAEALRARVVDRLVLFIAPTLMGGDGLAAIGSLGIRRAPDALRVADVRVARVGPDLLLDARIGRR